MISFFALYCGVIFENGDQLVLNLNSGFMGNAHMFFGGI